MQKALRSNDQQLSITPGETQVISVHDGGQLVCWLPFFMEGLEYLQERTNWNISSDAFLKAVFYAFNNSPKGGLVLVHVGDGAPLGFLVAMDVSSPFTGRVAQIHSIYTNKLCPASFLELVSTAFQWAKTFGYERVQTDSHKVKRSALFRFKKMFDGDPIVTFTKTL
jgi:hypothetical protein